MLQGVFSDESGDYPAGSYLRHPAGSQHAPFSVPGCRLFVKLNQFAAEDHNLLRLHPEHQLWVPDGQGREQTVLHRFGHELTLLQRCPAGQLLDLDLAASGELLVLDGGLRDSKGALYPPLCWLRDQQLGRRGLAASEDALVLIKLGSLARLLQNDADSQA